MPISMTTPVAQLSVRAPSHAPATSTNKTGHSSQQGGGQTTQADSSGMSPDDLAGLQSMAESMMQDSLSEGAKKMDKSLQAQKEQNQEDGDD